MYARTVKGQELTLVVSGMLWEMSLVIMDQETKSLWSHLLGEAMKGELEGETLEVIPSYLTDWKSWKASHPKTTCVVMPRTSDNYTRAFVQSDYQNQLLIGVTNANGARGWSFANLHSQTLVNDYFSKDKEPVVAIYDDAKGTAVVYGRVVDGRELTFSWNDGLLTDRETGSQWELLTGVASSGPLAGKSLGPQRGIVSLDHAWQSFHPKSSYWSPPKSPAAEAK